MRVSLHHRVSKCLSNTRGGEGGQNADEQHQMEGVFGQQSRGQNQFPNDGKDGELDPGVQQVLEIQLQAGQGQLSTQEFEEQFFC